MHLRNFLYTALHSIALCCTQLHWTYDVLYCTVPRATLHSLKPLCSAKYRFATRLDIVESRKVALADAINAILLMSPHLPRGEQQCCKGQNKPENEDESLTKNHSCFLSLRQMMWFCIFIFLHHEIFSPGGVKYPIHKSLLTSRPVGQ